jgi:hypothetical protein
MEWAVNVPTFGVEFFWDHAEALEAAGLRE